MQAFVFISFGFFVFMLFVIGLYFVLALAQKKHSNKIIGRKIIEVRELFKIIMYSDLPSQLQALMKLKKYFNSSDGVEAFRLAFIGCAHEKEITDGFRKSIATVVDFKKIYRTKNVKLSYRKIYVLNIISELHLETDKGNAFALENLKDSSLYVRNSALRVIQNQTNIDVMEKALNIMNEAKNFFNLRYTLDVLDNFKGSQQELDHVLIKNVDKFNTLMRTVSLNHFINTKNENSELKDKLIEYLNSSSNPEIVLLCARYFSRVYDERAKDILYRHLSHEDWRVRSVSVTSIAKYSDEKIINKIKQTILDPNYFVRRGSALSLIKLLDYKELFDMATQHENKRVRDILTYSFETEKIDGYKDYKLNEFLKINTEQGI